jgi:hypothetical protein
VTVLTPDDDQVGDAAAEGVVGVSDGADDADGGRDEVD